VRRIPTKKRNTLREVEAALSEEGLRVAQNQWEELQRELRERARRQVAISKLPKREQELVQVYLDARWAQHVRLRGWG
jgi:hypothetical protein